MASPEDKNVRKSRAVYHQKCDEFNVSTTFVVFLMPGGAALAPAYGLVGPVSKAPPGKITREP
jgi:hypothetical protein